MALIKKNWFLIGIISGLVVLTTLPYLIADFASGTEHVFGGFLFNPLDGNSYLAKMRQGWEGSWRFTLSYTAEAGEGAYLFLFYLLLGHISRLVGISNPVLYHIVRMMCLVFMLLAIYRFYAAVFLTKRQLRIAFILAVFGSGIGWLAMMFGEFTSDFWVAEAYPFLSAYANPHFPLGIAILVWLLTPGDGSKKPEKKPDKYMNVLKILLGAFILGVVMPFGIAIAVLVLGCSGLIESIGIIRQGGRRYRSSVSGKVYKAILAGFGGGPVLIYYFLVTLNDPIFADWNRQNLTASPGIWDFTIAFFPVLVFAVPGTVAAIKQRTKSLQILIVWSVLGLLLIWVPIGLQRRFMMGLYIPLAGLASMGVDRLLVKANKKRYSIVLFAMIFATITNLIVLIAGLGGIRTRDPAIYLTQGESQAFEWILMNTPEDALILTGPDTGLFIPAHTGRRVLYGHPFETVEAEKQKLLVSSFFQNPDRAWGEKLAAMVDYVFVGPREREISGKLQIFNIPLIYEYGGVSIYKADQ